MSTVGPQGGAPGAVAAYSGLGFGLLFQVDGLAPPDRFGAALAVVGDVDGDGTDDGIVGAPTEGGTGAVRVISGADDSVIRAVSGLAPGDRFGHAVAGAGDGDGVPDLIVGAPGTVGSSPPFGANGAVTVFSGADGSILHYVTGSIPGARTGRSVGAAGDVNGDGFDDVVIGAANAVTVVSDADGSPRVLLLASDPGLGTSLADGVDVDGDGIDLNGGGIPDVLAGAPAAESELRGGAVRKLAAAGAAP